MCRSERLAPRAREALCHLCQGLSDTEIAGAMGISVRTVRDYMADIFEVLSVPHRGAAIVEALRRGMVPPLHPAARGKSVEPEQDTAIEE